MERLTETAHRILKLHLKPGDVAIDATAGNGHDTLFLGQTVGPLGLVYAFDIQAAAIEQTRSRLKAAGLENVKLIQQNHADLAKWIPQDHHGKVGAITFNLGYLPGSDKRATTEPRTTRAALESAVPLLREEGVLTVLAYIGHPGGQEEAEAVEEWLRSLDEESFQIDVHSPNRAEAPRLYVIQRAKGSQ